MAITPYVHLTIASTDNIIHPIMRQPTDNGCAVANSRPWKLVTSMVHGARVACRETHLSADWIFKQSRRRRWQITAEREEKKEWVSEWVREKDAVAETALAANIKRLPAYEKIYGTEANGDDWSTTTVTQRRPRGRKRPEDYRIHRVGIYSFEWNRTCDACRRICT